MTPLEALIRQEILANGPMTVARYMELCLMHPEHGYYVIRDPLGAAGDFITAPEVSQMFGEMIGVWVSLVWERMGKADFNLVELGPGRGTLMADALRVLGKAGASPEVWFVEASPSLRAEQAKRVRGAKWAARFEDVPAGPAIYLANEFFDALPTRQFLRAEDAWRERVIGLDKDGLIWGLSPPTDDRSGEVGAWREVSPLADDLVGQIAKRLTVAPGAGLFIDYGYTTDDRPDGPTLQAVRKHAYSDPLQHPGQSDLTWLLDFDALSGVFASKGCSSRVAEQGWFLAQMGIGNRAEALAKEAPDRSELIADALERLTAPDQMGTLFKVLGAVSPGLALPPGLEPAE